MLTTILQWCFPRLRRRNPRLITIEAMAVDELVEELADDEPEPHPQLGQRHDGLG
jgi:hypothetical protein